MSYQEFSESVFPLIFIGLSVLPSLNNSVCFSALVAIKFIKLLFKCMLNLSEFKEQNG